MVLWWRATLRALRSSTWGVAAVGLLVGMLIVVTARLCLVLVHKDEFTQQELERVFKEVNSLQDEDEQVLDQLRLSEEETDEQQPVFNNVGDTLQNNSSFSTPNPNDPMAGGLHLITTYFSGTYSSERLGEIQACLAHNLANPHLRKIHILFEGSPPPISADSKLVLTKMSHQPTYAELFDYANGFLKRGAVAIIANADVYFDDSLRCVQPPQPGTPRFALEKQQRGGLGKRPFYGLTRRHAPECGDKPDYLKIYDLCEQYIGSHDAFIFAPPVAESIVKQLNHTQNAGLGAENVVIWALNHSGEWRGFNPCDLVLAYHLHCSQERAYSRIGADSRLVFVSGKQYNGGVRKHGWIKVYHWRKTITCPYEFW
jgi:hypothetical protein